MYRPGMNTNVTRGSFFNIYFAISNLDTCMYELRINYENITAYLISMHCTTSVRTTSVRHHNNKQNDNVGVIFFLGLGEQKEEYLAINR